MDGGKKGCCNRPNCPASRNYEEQQQQQGRQPQQQQPRYQQQQGCQQQPQQVQRMRATSQPPAQRYMPQQHQPGCYAQQQQSGGYAQQQQPGGYAQQQQPGGYAQQQQPVGYTQQQQPGGYAQQQQPGCYGQQQQQQICRPLTQQQPCSPSTQVLFLDSNFKETPSEYEYDQWFDCFSDNDIPKEGACLQRARSLSINKLVMNADSCNSFRIALQNLAQTAQKLLKNYEIVRRPKQQNKKSNRCIVGDNQYEQKNNTNAHIVNVKATIGKKGCVCQGEQQEQYEFDCRQMSAEPITMTIPLQITLNLAQSPNKMTTARCQISSTMQVVRADCSIISPCPMEPIRTATIAAGTPFGTQCGPPALPPIKKPSCAALKKPSCATVKKPSCAAMKKPSSAAMKKPSCAALKTPSCVSVRKPPCMRTGEIKTLNKATQTTCPSTALLDEPAKDIVFCVCDDFIAPREPIEPPLPQPPILKPEPEPEPEEEPEPRVEPEEEVAEAEAEAEPEPEPEPEVEPVAEAPVVPPKPPRKTYRLAYPQHKDLDICIKCRFDPSPLIDEDGCIFCPGNCGCCLCPWRGRSTDSQIEKLNHEKIKVCKCRDRGSLFTDFRVVDPICSTTSYFDVCPCREKAEAKYLELYGQEMWITDTTLNNKVRGRVVLLNEVIDISTDQPLNEPVLCKDAKTAIRKTEDKKTP